MNNLLPLAISTFQLIPFLIGSQLIRQCIEWYFLKYHSQAIWFKFGVKSLSKNGFLNRIWIVTSHGISALLVGSSIYFDSPTLFVNGSLCEIAHEMINLYNISMAKWYHKNSSLSASTFILLWNHHICTLLTGIPTVAFFSGNVYVRHISSKLLESGTICAFLITITYTRDINNLQQRSQFTLCQFVLVLLYIYYRIYVYSLNSYELIYYAFPEFSWKGQVMCSNYINGSVQYLQYMASHH